MYKYLSSISSSSKGEHEQNQTYIKLKRQRGKLKYLSSTHCAGPLVFLIYCCIEFKAIEIKVILKRHRLIIGCCSLVCVPGYALLLHFLVTAATTSDTLHMKQFMVSTILSSLNEPPQHLNQYERNLRSERIVKLATGFVTRTPMSDTMYYLLVTHQRATTS